MSRDVLKQRLEHVVALSAGKDESLADARRSVQALLWFEVYSHHLFQAMRAERHGAHAPGGQTSADLQRD